MRRAGEAHHPKRREHLVVPLLREERRRRQQRERLALHGLRVGRVVLDVGAHRDLLQLVRRAAAAAGRAEARVGVVVQPEDRVHAALQVHQRAQAAQHLVHQLEVPRLLGGALLEELEQVHQRHHAAQLDVLVDPARRALPELVRQVLQVALRRLEVDHVQPVLGSVAHVAVAAVAVVADLLRRRAPTAELGRRHAGRRRAAECAGSLLLASAAAVKCFACVRCCCLDVAGCSCASAAAVNEPLNVQGLGRGASRVLLRGLVRVALM